MNTEQLRKRAVASNDGNLCGPALEAADTIDELREDVADLRARLEKAEAERDAAFAELGSAVCEAGVTASDEALEQAAAKLEPHERWSGFGAATTVRALKSKS